MSSLRYIQILVFLYAFLIFSVESRKTQLQNNNYDTESSDDGAKGTRWAVLIAGSKDYYNYRHQVLLNCLLNLHLYNKKEKNMN